MISWRRISGGPVIMNAINYSCRKRAFDVKIDDGTSSKIYRLDRPYYGLHIPPGIWAEEISFSSGSICLVLTSHHFDELDYCRDYTCFLEQKKD